MFEWDERARGWLKGLFGDTNEKRLKFLREFAEAANNLESRISPLTDDELRAKTAEFKQRIENGLKDVVDAKLIPDDVPKMPGQYRTRKDKVLSEIMEGLLPEAFAVCREASSRVLGMRHFDVQFIGGAALHFNKIAEMRTGEGKTLVATLPAYLNALTGRGVHVVTVNDYLARRDSEWMGQLYKFLGLNVGLVYSHQPEQEKWNAYRADITYGTNHEFGFDYLRDNMRKSLDQLAQRDYYFAIVDEVDNILIDEARTPLIISGFPTESFQELYVRMAQLSPGLHRGKDKDDEECDYFVDEKARNVMLTEEGVKNGEHLLGVPDLYDMKYNFAHHLVQSLRAKELYKKDTDYVIDINEQGNPEIVIVDEFTGRKMHGRRWSDGLHQAIEAKEQVPIQEETLTYASITYQNLFRLYPKLAGMTGTAMTEAAEFSKIYNLDVVAIPTNKPSIRKDQADIIYKTEAQKYYSVIEDIVDLHEQGQPVLVGTTSIEKSELIAELLSKPEKMNQYLLNKIKKCVNLKNKQNISGPSIDALMKQFDRPGLIDPVKFEEVCKQIEEAFPKKYDEFVERCFSILRTAKVLSAIRKGIPHNVLNAKHHEREALIVAQAGRKAAVTIATNMAGRGTDILLGGNPEYMAKDKLKDSAEEDPEHEAKLKELTQKMKGEMAIEHEDVKSVGGLHIIGTERHEARRIDNQLRGRAGRQGDPGSTRFFLSLEDNLMRIFGGEKIAKLMDFMQADEEMPIESGMVTKSIENAQRKVESHHFDMRKHVLQYDDVLSTQREVIYRERRRILERADLRTNMIDMFEEHLDIVLETHIDSSQPPEAWEEEGSLQEVLKILTSDIPLLSDLNAEELAGLSYHDLRTKLLDSIKLAYEVRENNLGVELMRDMERQILLNTIDSKWVDYLHNIDLLREGIHLRGYGQRDPLQEYKREAFDMFNLLLRSIQEESIQLVFRAQPVMVDFDQFENAQEVGGEEGDQANDNKSDLDRALNEIMNSVLPEPGTGSTTLGNTSSVTFKQPIMPSSETDEPTETRSSEATKTADEKDKPTTVSENGTGGKNGDSAKPDVTVKGQPGESTSKKGKELPSDQEPAS
jgi:preprotein translocase subunit SecA